MIPRRWRLVELSDGLVMEHEWAPGRVLRSPDEDRDDPDSTHQRFLNLPIPKRLNVYNEILELFLEIEEQDVIIEDFYDGCVLYDFDTDRAHVCDLDHLHRGPYILTKERQFGSSRFMAPGSRLAAFRRNVPCSGAGDIGAYGRQTGVDRAGPPGMAACTGECTMRRRRIRRRDAPSESW
jgi:hypothetical protein